MTLLGQFALWTAFLVGIWGSWLAFAGKWQDRPELIGTITRTTYALLLCLGIAAAALWVGIIGHDFNIEYVAA